MATLQVQQTVLTILQVVEGQLGLFTCMRLRWLQKEALGKGGQPRTEPVVTVTPTRNSAQATATDIRVLLLGVVERVGRTQVVAAALVPGR
jgi:hypothetical protein